MIHIAYSGNSKVFKGLLLSAMSIVKHYKKPVTIHILTMDLSDQNPSYTPISEKQVALLQDILKQTNPENQVKLHDVTNFYKQELTGKNKKTEYTPYTLIRLLIDKIDDMPDKVAYLDTDTMVTNDISELYNIDIENYEFAAALDYMGKFWIAKDYFNAGVILINIKHSKETDLFAKCRDLVNKKWLKMPDQSALYRNKTNILYIDGKFNEQRNIKPNTVVKHFNKGIKYFPFFHIYNIKQWEIDKVHKKFKIHDFDDIYEQYAKLLETQSELILN